MDDKEQQALNATDFGNDPQRPADNARIQPVEDPNLNPFSVFTGHEDEHDGEADAPADDERVEPKPASMSMTKAELLERLHEHEDGLTKAEILERIQAFEHGAPDETEAVSAPLNSTTGRTATIDGVTYSWTEATEDTVPPAAREVWAQSKATGG